MIGTSPRSLLIVVLTSLAACTSGRAGSPAATNASSMAPVLGTDMRTRMVDGQDVTSIQSPMSRVWTALPIAYDSIGIPLTVVDGKQHMTGNQGFKLQGRLGKVPLSTYVDCGSGTFGRNADSYEVYLSVITRLRATDSLDTDVITTVDAAARPMSLSQPFTKCGSKGAIEARIADLVQAIVRRK
jgi:hypothetical protein